MTHIEVPNSSFSSHYDIIKKQIEWYYLYGEFHYTDISHTFSGDLKYCFWVNAPKGSTPELIFCSQFNDMQ